ncbi:MAG: methyltransferase domain-containing protein [Cyanobacteriota bacterium]
MGCGDFQVGQQLLPLCSSYIGIDIVKVLIENNNNKFKDTKASFLCLNIIEDDLPTGDVCFVRQVLQHLSNAEITKILALVGLLCLTKKRFMQWSRFQWSLDSKCNPCYKTICEPQDPKFLVNLKGTSGCS